jgi:hypothetical protein
MNQIVEQQLYANECDILTNCIGFPLRSIYAELMPSRELIIRSTVPCVQRRFPLSFTDVCEIQELITLNLSATLTTNLLSAPYHDLP